MKSMKGITQALIALFIVIIVIYLLAAIADLLMVGLLIDVSAGGGITFEQASIGDMFQVLTGVLQSGFFIITSIVFLVWFHRAYKNIHSFGLEGIKYTPGWAVGYWFIPILNIFRPLQMTQEIWRASEAVHESKVETWRQLDVPPLISWWWATFLGSNFIARFSVNIASSATDPEGFLRSQLLWLISDLFYAFAAYVAIRMVKLISDSQEKIQVDRIISDKIDSLVT